MQRINKKVFQRVVKFEFSKCLLKENLKIRKLEKVPYRLEKESKTPLGRRYAAIPRYF